MVIVVAEILDVVQRLRPKKNIYPEGSVPVFMCKRETEEFNVVLWWAR